MSSNLPPKLSSPYTHGQELSPTLAAAPLNKPKRRWIDYGVNGLLALVLLLAGMPLAWFLGLNAARVFAGPRDRIPFQEILLRRTNRIITEVQRLPSRWRPAPPLETRIEPIPIPTQPVAPLTTPPAVLNQRDRQIVAEELAALKQEFTTIQKRLFDLESKLGQAQSTANVENRLATLDQHLNPPQVSTHPATLPATPSSKSLSSQERDSGRGSPQERDLGRGLNPLLDTTELKITLPSDALFAPGEARLLTTAPALLDSIFKDLAPYPQATVLIGSYTDDRMEPSQSVSLAYQQANALRAYLAGKLPDRRWIAIGYGQHQSLTDNSTPPLRQRNRRIEIAIDRR